MVLPQNTRAILTEAPPQIHWAPSYYRPFSTCPLSPAQIMKAVVTAMCVAHVTPMPFLMSTLKEVTQLFQSQGWWLVLDLC